MPAKAENDSQRLFFGLPLPDSARSELQAARERIALPATARPSLSQNYHLTLVFLGQVKSSQLACVQRAAERIHTPSFQLRLDHLGHWPRPQALWAAPSAPPDALQRLVTDLQQQLGSCGFSPEQREYRPHVTLARRLPTFSGPCALAAITWQARQFQLYRSVSTPDGVRYQPIGRWELAEA